MRYSFFQGLLENNYFIERMYFMNFSENWGTFVQTLSAHAIGTYRNSSEYAYYRHRQKDMEEILTNSLVEDEKELVDEVLLELETRADREMEVVYRQGLRDSVTMLRV